jgi:hypothetical protein
MTRNRLRPLRPILILVASCVGCGASGGSDSGEGSHDGATDAPKGGSDGGGQTHDGGAGPPDSTSAGQSEAGTTDGATDGEPTTPTVSSWMGTNVNADLPFVDVTRMMSGFNTSAAQLDVNGYPVAGASGTSSTDLGYLLPSGMYNLSFVGDGTLSISGIGATTGAWQTVAGEQRNQVNITGTPGAFGNFLTLTVANTGSQTVTAIHLYLPGIAYDAADPFNPSLIGALSPFRAMRFMEWEDTNNSTLADWAQRPTATQFGASSFGEPYELIVELINETGKDGWINVPQAATTDFITQFATFMATNLDFTRIAAARHAAGFTTPFQLIVENSNEAWNTGFSAYMAFLNAANEDTAKYTGTYTGAYGPSWMSSNSDLMEVGQYEADRLVTIGTAFKTAFKGVGQESVVAPVLSGWALGAVYSDEGLQFIQTNYGDPKDYVAYVALAPYFATADDTTTGSLATLFPALQADITSMDSAFQGFQQLSTQYGIAIAAYEGGQGITGTTNEPIKHLSQFDERMYETYTQYFTFWKQYFGPSLFMHFDLAGDPGLPESIYQYGFWGSLPGVEADLTTCGQNLPTLTGTEAVASVMQYCPKYKALADHVPE